MIGEEIKGAMEPFTDSIKELDAKRESLFMGRKVKTGFIVLIFDDGTVERGAFSAVGEGNPEHFMLASKIIHETLLEVFGGERPDGERLN